MLERFRTCAGIVDFGGPLPDVVYRCFEWEPCEIEDLQGSSLSRLVARLTRQSLWQAMGIA